MSKSIFFITVLFIFPTLIKTQKIYIIDSQARPGFNFKDLQKAVSTVPSGSYLFVRDGLYSPFSVSGKVLHIRGSGSAPIGAKNSNIKSVYGGPLHTVISNVPAGGTFVIEGFFFSSGYTLFGQTPSAPALILEKGNFYLHDLVIFATGGKGAKSAEFRNAKVFAKNVNITGMAYMVSMFKYSAPPDGLYISNTKLSMCDSVLSVWPSSSQYSYNGGVALEVTSSSFVDIFKTTIGGGIGKGGKGGNGIELLAGSRLLADGSYIEGGQAGSSFSQSGYGIFIGANSSASIAGSLVLGGWDSTKTSRGPAFGGSGACKNRSNYSYRPHLEIKKIKAHPDSYDLVLSGPPNKALFLVIGIESGWDSIGTTNIPGILFIKPGCLLFQILPPVFLPGSGKTTIHIPIIPGKNVEGPLFIQSFMFPINAQTIGSNLALISVWP